MYYGYDPTYILLIPAIILTMYAQFKVSSTTNKYFRVVHKEDIQANKQQEKF